MRFWLLCGLIFCTTITGVLAASTYCIQLNGSSPICFNNSITTGTKINWSDILNAQGGGSVTQITFLSPFFNPLTLTTTGTPSINSSAFCLSNGSNCQAGGSGITSIQANDSSIIVVNASSFKVNGTWITTAVGNFTNNATTWSTCIAGQYSRWNGSAFACFGDNSNPGTVTQINSGTYTTGGIITTSGTLDANITKIAQDLVTINGNWTFDKKNYVNTSFLYNLSYYNSTTFTNYYPILTNPLNYLNTSQPSGWVNTSTTVYLANNASNVSVDWPTTLFIDNTNMLLQVNASLNFTNTNGCIYTPEGQLCWDVTSHTMNLTDNNNLTGVGYFVNSTCAYMKGQDGSFIGAGC